MPERARSTERSLVLGHELCVFPLGDHDWNVSVDGEDLHAHWDSQYQAWAAGVAESYRRGHRAPPRAPGDLP